MSEQALSKPTQPSGQMPVGSPQKTSQGFGLTTAERSAELAATAVAASAKAEVEAAYVMAIHNRRNEDDSRIRVLNRCKNLIFAESAIYNKPIGKTQIRGLSIRFAEEMLRLWGNIKVLQNVIFEDENKRIVKVTVIDLEANASYSSEIIIEKHVERKDGRGREIISERVNSFGEKVFIVKATEDEMQNKAGSLVSKLIRNNGLKLIPAHIREEAFDTIEATVKSGVDKDPEAYKRKITDGFAQLGVPPSELKKYIGHSLTNASPAEIADLRKIYNAISEGDSKWQDFITTKGEMKKEPGEGVLDDLGAGDPTKHKPVNQPIGKPTK